ncbi:hypothetical protein [Cellulomonas soli]|uniref:Uncharacterized protein n=1 Tax=Cellulomonas soli TaxID=931535 RepID=A0A512PED0_9CELL|nr:hypothetical protein [Cellulomonas soli]NYI58938.1 hypothetical protein [Cellulomonas soli]GEP69569.1 hypothetical protein CSO01_22840 [Cellulomonas soli]
MKRGSCEWAYAEIADLGLEATRRTIAAVVATFAPAYLLIDAYGSEPLDEPGRRALDALLAVPSKNGGAGIVMSRGPKDVEHLLGYGPFTAGLEIGLTGPVDLVLEVWDSECLGVALTEDEQRRAGISLREHPWHKRSRSTPPPPVERQGGAAGWR